MTDKDAVRVLVVDDESSIREVLEDFLSMEGFDVTCASNGKEGVGALDQTGSSTCCSST